MAAIISSCGRFRYSLRRTWDSSLPTLGFIMLNPSTADSDRDDPTIRKCVGFAKRLGYGSILVNNLFAYRATDPKELRAQGYPVGEDNDAHIAAMNSEVERTICAWGVWARHMKRADEVLNMVDNPYALDFSFDGIPKHPLMLAYSQTLLKMRT